MVSAIIHLLALTSSIHTPSQELVIRGRPSVFRTFEGIPENLRPHLTYFELHNVKFNPDLLLSSLQGCTSLETINLRRVKWEGEFGSRVTLPKLKEFKIQIRNMTFRSMTKDQFKALLFFDKEAGVEWRLQDLPTLGIDISVNYGIQSLEFNLEEGRVELMHLPFNNELLSTVKSNHLPITELTLLHGGVSLSNIPKGLRTLSMSSVNLRGGDLNYLFKRLRKLEEVDVEGVTSERFVAKTFDLSTLPTNTLKKLDVGSLTVSLSSPTEFKELFHLRLMSCPVLENFGMNFGQAFKNVKEVEIIATDPIGNHRLLKTMMEETRAESIHFSNFLRSEGGGDAETEAMEAFLVKAKVPDDQQYFSLEKINGEWRWKDPADSGAWRF